MNLIYNLINYSKLSELIFKKHSQNFSKIIFRKINSLRNFKKVLERKLISKSNQSLEFNV